MHIRKLFTAIDETMSEMGREANEPLRKVAVVAVVKNPLAGQGYVEDLSGLIDDVRRRSASGSRPWRSRRSAPMRPIPTARRR